MKVGKVTEKQQILYPPMLVEEPELSIVMPTYCRAHSTLEKAIKSVLAQTFTNFEFIIVDDGSRDGSFDILKKYQQQDHRIIILHHEVNSGLPAVRTNEGVLLARGKYIAYQFDDDEWLPDCLESLVAKRKEIDEPCVVYGTCEAKLYDGKECVLTTKLGREFDREYFYNNNFIANNAVLHDKEIIYQCGLYDPHLILRRSCDYDLWLRYSKEYKMVWINKVVSRVSSGSADSLGRDITMDVIKYSNIRKYITLQRNSQLLPDKIEDFVVDDLYQYHHYFTQQDIYDFNMQVKIPFLAMHHLEDVRTPLIQTNRKTDVLVSRKLYHKDMDHLVNQKLQDYNGYHYYYLCEGELTFIHRDAYEALVIQGPTYTTTLDKIKAFHEKPLILIEDDWKGYPNDELYNYQYLKDHAQIVLQNFHIQKEELNTKVEVSKLINALGKGEIIFFARTPMARKLATAYKKALSKHEMTCRIISSEESLKGVKVGYLHLFDPTEKEMESLKKKYSHVPLSITILDEPQTPFANTHALDLYNRNLLAKNTQLHVQRFFYPMEFNLTPKKKNSLVIYLDGRSEKEYRTLMAEYRNLRRGYDLKVYCDEPIKVPGAMRYEINKSEGLMEALTTADYYLHLSDNNKYLIMAMEAGCIPIAMNNPRSKELVKDNFYGYLIKEVNLTAALVRIARTTLEEAKEMRRSIRNLIEYYGDEAYNLHELLVLFNETMRNMREER